MRALILILVLLFSPAPRAEETAAQRLRDLAAQWADEVRVPVDPAVQPPVERPPTPEALTFELLEQIMSDLTDAQFDEVELKLRGMRVAGKGQVVDVAKNLLDGFYEVGIDVGGTGVRDVSFDVPKQVGLALNKGNYYRFTGVISRVHKIFGNIKVTLESVTFLED